MKQEEEDPHRHNMWDFQPLLKQTKKKRKTSIRVQM